MARHASHRYFIKFLENLYISLERPWGLLSHAYLEDDGTTLVTDVRMDRVFLVPGLFYGMEGMRIGGNEEGSAFLHRSL